MVHVLILQNIESRGWKLMEQEVYLICWGRSEWQKKWEMIYLEKDKEKEMSWIKSFITVV